MDLGDCFLLRKCVPYLVGPRGGCAHVIMHHELATPTPIGQYKKFNRIQHQFNTKINQGLLQVFMLQFKDLTS